MPLETLRQALKTDIGEANVSDRLTTYYFDDDTAAFASIVVHQEGTITVAIDNSGTADALKRSVWLRFIREFWLLHPDKRQISVTTRQGEFILNESDMIASVHIEPIGLTVGQLFDSLPD